MPDTISGLLTAAADRDPDGIWLRTDEGTLSFAAAAGQVGRLAERLRETGVGRGDLVVLIARTTPPYLLCWLALAALGAITVPTDPVGTQAELAALVGQVEPRLTVDDEVIHPLVGDWRMVERDGRPPPTDVRPDDLAVLIPTSGTTGRSKLVMQTHRAYAMAGEGFPYWMELTAADRLMTSLPLFHINAPAYSVLGSLACGAGLVLLPRFSASGFLDSARAHGATEFKGLRIVCGYALSESPYGLIWRHGERPFGTLGAPRQHPTLGTVNEARVVDDELQLRNPTVTPGYWEMPTETASTVVDGWLPTGDLVTENADGTYTFVSRLKRCCAGVDRTCRPPRSRTRSSPTRTYARSRWWVSRRSCPRTR
ncbi:MAG: AMP-binding protein [Geodermatophilaceae bacterium]|nr:AMP-binding protein [Geodermatophilaceae bacterium]